MTKWRWLPNALSLTRGVVISPLVLYTSLLHDWTMAFFLLLLGGLTDMLDGLLAAKLNVRSKIGGIIDMLSDGALMGALIIGLVAAGNLSLKFLCIVSFVGAIFFIVERAPFVPKRIAVLGSGLAPFWGVGLGITIGAITIKTAFGNDILYYLVPLAIIVGGAIAVIKRDRIKELLDKIIGH